VSDLAQALMVAIRTHADQVDKQGEPYLLHVLRVVEAVSDEAKVVAALHDVLEDGGEAGRRRARGLDLTSIEANALRTLTRIKGVEYGAYINYIAAPVGDPASKRIAREVKLADLRDNLGCIPAAPAWRSDGRGPDNAPESIEHSKWSATWASLKARYEKAIETLERVA
jgi:hypothetical protein